ncbi:hypothetical protein ACL9RF_01130 [Sphingobacterium sp. Mn56C]|uniref:hypothetical protein n=1 Tax=Sphingobacterium sp. Mn56C TaxID=3395261 RepID=UPI003BE27613
MLYSLNTYRAAIGSSKSDGEWLITIRMAHKISREPAPGIIRFLIGIMAVFYPTSVKVQHAAPLHL